MKQFNFLSALIAVLLMVTAVSCTTLQGATDDEYYSDYRRTAPNRIYVDDPYYGTVVLEKDPYSGRYYQVSPYGNSNRYAYNNRYWSDYRAPRNRNRYYSNSNRNNYPAASQGQTEQQKIQQQEKREEARRKVLGN